MTRMRAELKPTHVYHATALKHVLLMECHLVDALENNILGTWAAPEPARAAGARTFVLISTDKAVRPTSVMGATKRFVELLASERTKAAPIRSVIVRFGDMLGSDGGAVPLLQRQIAGRAP
jgi:FlaA1/EpsC-like NDP-sugar epimerase